MQNQIRKRITARQPLGPARPQDQKHYRKALRAAARYVAAVRACIECDPDLRFIRSMPPIFQDGYVRELCTAGITGAWFPREKIGASRARGRDWREPFLYFFQDNVELEYHVREINRPYKVWLR
jgi:hypothetical protein